MITATVSNLDLYRTWAEMEGVDPNWLVEKLASKEQTEKMAAGVAFHKAMENLPSEGDFGVLTADGYRFDILCDVSMELPKLREMSLTGEYGGLWVRGRVDGCKGKVINDFKTTGQFDPERYMESFTWRFYLDLSDADRFDYHVFVTSEKAEKHYEVYQYHKLSQFRYPGLHKDCLEVALEYERFAERFLPTLV